MKINKKNLLSFNEEIWNIDRACDRLIRFNGFEFPFAHNLKLKFWSIEDIYHIKNSIYLDFFPDNWPHV